MPLFKSFFCGNTILQTILLIWSHLILALCPMAALLDSEPRPNTTTRDCTHHEEKLIQRDLSFFSVVPLSLPVQVSPSPLLAHPIKLKWVGREWNCSYGAMCAPHLKEERDWRREFIANPFTPFTSR